MAFFLKMICWRSNGWSKEIAPRGKLLRSWSLKGGRSAEMTALEFENPDGPTSRMILRRPGAETLKQNPQAAWDEFKLLQITHSLGLATPAPLDFDPSGQIFTSPLPGY